METPKIILAGKEWLIPKMAVKQNRVIVPLIINIIPIFNEWAKDKQGTYPKISDRYSELLDITYYALTRGYPELKREEFENMEITFPEVIGAYITIAEQTGIFAKAGTTGEATPSP